jgi:hypothetical protein
VTQKYVDFDGTPAIFLRAHQPEAERDWLIYAPGWGEISVRAREVTDISRDRALEMIATEFTEKAQGYYNIGMSKTEILRVLIGVITALVFEREAKL